MKIAERLQGVRIPAVARRKVLLGATAALATPRAVLASDQYASSPFRSFTDAQWKARLPSFAYEVLRREATERPWTSPLLDEHRTGVFACLGCGLPLFRSTSKFDSGTGWPSFYDSIKGAIASKVDTSFGMVRTEYHCARCLGHQGHIFNDGPQPTGLRYCDNGVALTFKPA